MRNDLEVMAVDMARETGCDLETARLAIRVTLLKLRLGLGQMTQPACGNKRCKRCLSLARVTLLQRASLAALAVSK